MTRTLRRLAATVLLLFPLAALAQVDAEVVGGTASALPIAVVPFAGSTGENEIGGIVAADLARSGAFRVLPDRDLVERPTRSSEVNYATWRLLKQEFLLVGRVMPEGGNLRVEYELFDVAKQTRILGEAKIAPGTAARDLAHQVADSVYEKILGVRGAFWTRIAYVTASGTGNNRHFALMVADSDGFNSQAVVSSPQPILSPSWSPDGKRLAYVSFDRGNSSIYIQNLTSSGRELVASFRGINGAPSFSPDGTKLAMTLSRSGNPEVYVMDLGSKQLRQITNHFGIDTEPAWSADGGTLYFTSDRGGKPQIYQARSERRRRDAPDLRGQLQRARHGLGRRQEDRHRAGQRQHLPHRADGPHDGQSVDAVVAGQPRRIAELRPQRIDAAVRRERRRAQRVCTPCPPMAAPARSCRSRARASRNRPGARTGRNAERA